MTEISAVQSIWDGFDFSYILEILLGVVPSLICITIHELSHGLAAYKLGDNTAKCAGRLTLNPLKHLDPVGLLMMMIFHVGWAKPVPVNMYNFRHPKRGMAVTAIAGPLSNVLISIVFLVLYGALYVPLGLSGAGEYFLKMIELTAYISLGMAVFNLIPLPPLDGSKFMFSLLTDEEYRKLMWYERYGTVILLILFATGIMGKPINALINYFYTCLFPIARWACDVFVQIVYL